MPTNPSAPPVRAEFARRLKALRVPRGFATARSFAAALSIDENRYTRYERAEVEPDLSLLSKICGLLHVTPNELLGADGFAGAPAGFAEPAAVPPSPPATVAPSPRSALAWQLAEALCGCDGPMTDRAIDRISRTARVFAEIDGDPFAFMKQIACDGRLAALDHAAAERVGAIASSLLAMVNSELLGKNGSAAP